jgi:hypothetical protein
MQYYGGKALSLLQLHYLPVVLLAVAAAVVLNVEIAVEGEVGD